MQRPYCPLADVDAFCGRPTVGLLMALCEENFALLGRLAPRVRDQHGVLVSRGRAGVDLHLIVEEQSPYTTLVRLTHYFPSDGPAWGPDPDLRLRIYHDARQVEVESLRQTALPMRSDYQKPALGAKWKVNLFLSKWLRYCLQDGHRFVSGRAGVSLAEDDDLVQTCT